MIKIDATAFNEALADIRRIQASYRSVVESELKAFGDESVEKLKTSLETNAFNLPPKKRDDGKPPLIDSGKYINGFVCVVDDYQHMGIYSEGMNDHMSNNDLSELLEYGNGSTIPARPHIRPLFVWMESQAPKVGERIFNRLFGGI